ncbi:MAG: prepilin-type N-terminal cleavage/methylation domain-containing protein [Acidobacteriota bacterium]
MKKNRGMTVIELMVTLMVFSVTLLVVLGMSRGGINRTGLKSTSNEILGMINMVKAKAAKENRPIALSFTGTTYREHFYESGSWTPELKPSALSDGEVATGTTIIAYSTIAFNSRGILIDPTTFMINPSVKLTLQSDQGDGIKIKVISYGGVKVKNSWRDSAEFGGF